MRNLIRRIEIFLLELALLRLFHLGITVLGVTFIVADLTTKQEVFNINFHFVYAFWVLVIINAFHKEKNLYNFVVWFSAAVYFPYFIFIALGMKDRYGLAANMASFVLFLLINKNNDDNDNLKRRIKKKKERIESKKLIYGTQKV